MSPVTANTRSSIAWVVVLAGIGSFMAALDTVVVSTALPTIRVDLGASVSQLEWTINAYNLAFAVTLITAAALGDRFGRRRLYAAGLAAFALASAGNALSPSVGWLIASRAVQGVAAAFVLSLGLALLSAAFPPEKRGMAIGLFSAVTGLAVASGPLVGGVVVHGLDWSWIFWLNVPIGVIAAPLVLSRMRESFGSDSALDLRGLGLISAGAFGIVWGLVRGNSAGWGSPEVIATLLVVGPIAGMLADRIGERPLMGTGMVIQAAGAIWIGLIASPDLAYSRLVVAMVFAGIGLSMALPSAQASVLGAVSQEAVGKAAGTNTMMRELGGVFGIAVAVAVFAAAGSYVSPQAFVDGC